MIIQIAREEIRCLDMGYSFRLAAIVLLYALSHRQDRAVLPQDIEPRSTYCHGNVHRSLRLTRAAQTEGRKEMFYLTTHSTQFDWGGGGEWYVCAYITLTNNYLAYFIYQLIILWTILIN